MGLQLKAALRVSFWVTFHRCFVELASTTGVNVGIYLPRASKS
jgi:hypothetical protein